MSIYGLFFNTKKLANGPSNQAKPHHYKNKQKTIADKNNKEQKLGQLIIYTRPTYL